ncbi:hypothetical protein Rsub_11140 [Raphidocelis subcapitata]|uniref:Protein TIC 20 n=1 Tax=Raphidocelis subcapitata TaxID=307507 RepID=A0A2V0PET1_9CHLO|nr:hypothetical protein Rsub_11140 [Raphidocelis subcapitata]|eukprot:GBF98029.1 hypothetical protein Rsub_11140 [Raphidocelis subcapitata]
MLARSAAAGGQVHRVGRGVARAPALPRRTLGVRRGEVQQCHAYTRRGPPATDRLAASLPYLLPLLDTLPFGRYIFLQMPYVARALAPLGPLFTLYHALPFAPFLAFLAIYSGVVNNTSLPRFIRYNAAQAVVLDILVIVPQVLLEAFGRGPHSTALDLSIGDELYISACSTVFMFVAVCTAYGMGSCAVGQTPRLPLVADAAEQQLRDGPSGF